MGKLSLRLYTLKCILGAEIVYVLCLIGGYLPLRSEQGVKLHHTLFETLPWFTWGSLGSYIWGAILIALLSWIFGAYMVWMHNSSIIERS